jgi:hypothetical protein
MAQGLDSVTLAFIARMNTLSGLRSSPVLDATAIYAVDTFVKGCRADGIWSKMIEINGFIFVSGTDRLFVAASPLLIGPQGATDNSINWHANNFVDADVTVNGLVGNASNKSLVTNMDPTGTFPGTNDVGISMYVSTVTATANTIDVGAFSSANDACLLLYANSFNQCAAGCWNPGGTDGPTTGAGNQPNKNGFYSFSRTASNDTRLYFANSTNTFAQIGVNTGSVSGAIFSTRKLTVFACTANTGSLFDFSDRRLSFMAFHKGMTSTETQKLYNRVQQFRTDLGGGFT